MAENRGRWRQELRWATATIIATAGVGTAGAQTITTTAPASAAAGLTFGQPSKELDITVGGEALYDSNVARASDAGAIARRLKKEDVRFSPTLEANVSIPTGKALFTLQGLAGYDFYARNSRLNRERINLIGTAGSKLARCDVGVQGGFARSQNDLADLSIVPGDERASSENVQTVASIGGTIACGAEIGLRPTAFVGYRHSDNSASVREVSDFSAFSYGGGVSYSNPAFGIASLFGGRTEFSYPDRTGLLASGADFNSTFVGVRLDRRLGARLQFNGQVTYVDIDRSSGTANSFSGINWDVNASLRVGQRAELALGTSRQVDASAGFNARTTETSTYSLQGTYALSPLLRASITASHRKRNFDTVPDLTPVFLLSNDNIDEVVGRLTYTANRKLSVYIGAGYQDRDSDLAIYSYDSFRASLGARLKL
jgi:hypothetical protein